MYQYIPTDVNNFPNVNLQEEYYHYYQPEESVYHGAFCPYNYQNVGMIYPRNNSSHENNKMYPHQDMMMHPHHDLLNTIQHCETACEHLTHILHHKHDVHRRMEQLTLLRDCADICTLMAKYLARMSDYSKSLAKLCAKICKACGKECEKFEDHESQHCAKICLHCAEKCEDFAE